MNSTPRPGVHCVCNDGRDRKKSDLVAACASSVFWFDDLWQPSDSCACLLFLAHQPLGRAGRSAPTKPPLSDPFAVMVDLPPNLFTQQMSLEIIRSFQVDTFQLNFPYRI